MKLNIPRSYRPGTRRKLAGALGLLLVLGLLLMPAVPAMGISPPGHTFWGTVTVNGAPAEDGMLVEAMIAGAGTVESQYTDSGQYGYAAQFLVPSDDPGTPVIEGGSPGGTVDFYVEGVYAGSFTGFASGGFDEFNLDVVIEPKLYELEVTSSGCCDITVEYDGDSYTVDAGTTQTYLDIEEDTDVTLTANPVGDCMFVNWQIDQDTPVTDNPVVITMTDNRTAVATCVPTYELEVTSSGCCDITVAYDSESYTVDAGTMQTYGGIPEGTDVTLTAVPLQNCEFLSWQVDQDTPVTDNPVVVTMNANHSANATCGPTYDLEVTSSGCCDITVEYDGESYTVDAGTMQTYSGISEGTDVTLTAVESSGCMFTEWQIDQDTPVTDNPVTVTMNDNHSAVATCVPTYELEVTSFGCCDITVEYDQVVDTVNAGTTEIYSGIVEGTDVTLTAVPRQNCEFLSWQIDLDTPVTDNPVTVTMDDNHSAVATSESTSILIYLEEGWNTFSIPIALDPTIDTWDEFITYNGLSINAALFYDSAQEIWVSGQSGEPIELLEGYYLYMGAYGVAEILPNPAQSAPPKRLLVSGLNFIGIATLNNVNVASYLSTVYMSDNGMGYTLVLNPAINPQGGWTDGVYMRNGANPPYFMIGKAYWVHMINPLELVGWTQTPLEP